MRVLAEDGKVLTEETQVQHNRFYSSRREILAKMLAVVIAALKGDEAVAAGA